MKSKSFKLPHVFIFLSGIILLCALLTYIIPSGAFERTTKKVGNIERVVVVQGSYKELPKHYSIKGVLFGEKVEGYASPVSVMGLLTAIPRGLQQSAVLVFFIFIIGATFGLIHHTGAIAGVLFWLIDKFQNSTTLLFFLIYLFLSSCSSFMGIQVEMIPLIPIILLLAKKTGYDRMFGFGLVAVPIFIGWTCAITNPYTVNVAQKIAELPIGSGMGLRVVLFIFCLFVGFSFLMRYGNKVKKDKRKSIMPDDTFDLKEVKGLNTVILSKRHILILAFMIGAYGSIMFAVQKMGWGIMEMSGGFLAIAIVTILLDRMSGDEAMVAVIKGLEDMIIPALVVGIARAISVVMVDGQIIDTVLYHASEALSTLPVFLASEGMMLFQSGLNFFIPSASGQALVSMPLMTPLSDLLGISRQTAVLAFMLGDGFSNILIPTNGVLMAMLGVAAIPFGKWFRFVLPLFAILTGIAVITMFIAVSIGY